MIIDWLRQERLQRSLCWIVLSGFSLWHVLDVDKVWLTCRGVHWGCGLKGQCFFTTRLSIQLQQLWKRAMSLLAISSISSDQAANGRAYNVWNMPQSELKACKTKSSANNFFWRVARKNHRPEGNIMSRVPYPENNFSLSNLDIGGKDSSLACLAGVSTICFSSIAPWRSITRFSDP